MANEEHVALLKQGVDAWNEWREQVWYVDPDLSEAVLSEADLSKADFSKTDLSGAHLRKADLSEADLSEADLTGASVSEAVLSKADLRKATLCRADLSNATLSRANLSEATLSNATLSEANLTNANLVKANLKEANLSQADLSRANLRGAYLGEANLSETDLSGTDLSGNYLGWADLSGANLHKANLRETNLHKANLSEADLRGVDLSGADLTRVDLRGKNLSTANLSWLNLRSNDLIETDLSGVDLRGTNLIDARLNRATLTAAKLWGTQRDGWSIQGVRCEHVFWDRHAEEPTSYVPGEFERLHRETVKIELQYPGGIHRIEILTLPMLLQYLEQQHEGIKLRLHSITDAPAGARATIVVDETGGQEVAELQAILQHQAQERQELERALLAEREGRLRLEGGVEQLRKVLESAISDKMQINIGRIGKVGSIGEISGEAEVTIDQSAHYSQDDVTEVKNLINDILSRRTELDKELPANGLTELEALLQAIQSQLTRQSLDNSLLQKSLTNVQRILEGANTNVAASGWLRVLEGLV